MWGPRKTGLALTAALIVASPAQAVMGCWNETHAAAAQVRNLQSRLMVASLRCVAMGYDVTPAYNRFVRASRETIQGANGVILAQFRAGHGGQAQFHYDRFATMLANAYGADDTSEELCAETAMVADEAAQAAGDIRLLVALADRLGATPELPGGRCSITFAAAAAPSPN
jgi:hypothetical protein